MDKFEYVSARGNVLSLSHGQNYYLINIDSQTAVNSALSSVETINEDGDEVVNAKVQPRTIILELHIISDVEKTKREILNVIKVKQKGTLRCIQNDRTIEIKGIVESIEMPRWKKGVVIQITMHCEQPFWENIEYVVSRISEAINLHYFTEIVDDMLYFPEEGIPFGEYDTLRTKEFINAGDVAVGLEIEIVAYKTVTNPKIYNQDGKFFGCGSGSGNKQVVMQTGDTIKINTKKNEKSVTLNGVSILGKVKPQSTWLQLEAGENEFSISSDDESIDNMSFSLIYKERYI